MKFSKERHDNDIGTLNYYSYKWSSHLPLHDAVGDAHLAAEGGQPYDELNGVHVVGDHDEGRLLLLDESSHVLETELDHLANRTHTSNKKPQPTYSEPNQHMAHSKRNQETIQKRIAHNGEKQKAI